MVFEFPVHVVRSFDLAKFFGVKPVNRINTLASPEMIRDRLITEGVDRDDGRLHFDSFYHGFMAPYFGC